MKLIKTSPISGKEVCLDIPLTDVEYALGLALWRNGRLIQNAFPTLSPELREFIMTGISPQEWDEAFPAEEVP